MYCRDCPRYDQENKRCLDGKLNPEKWDLAVSVAQVFGLRSICTFNDHRERLVKSREPLTQAEIAKRVYDP
ncbi:MAG TPA: hypothetical protein VG944_13200 [Fimbriimonas sp.]|nr:hypothetical protein [Fimbriimonas sp.]